MNREQAIAIIRKEYLCVDRDCDIDRSCGKCDLMIPSKEPILEAYKMAIKALEQEPKYCDRNICIKNEYNGISCDECEVTKSQEPNTGHWIPVSERLPEDKTYVLTTIKVPNRIAHARSGWYEGGFFHNDNGDVWKATDMEAIAWMPLPKPYEPQESEG